MPGPERPGVVRGDAVQSFLHRYIYSGETIRERVSECKFALAFADLLADHAQKYGNTAFLHPLIEDMTQRNPLARCSASQALNIFDKIVSERSPHSLRWRLKAKNLGGLQTLFVDVGSLSHEGIYLAKYALCT